MRPEATTLLQRAGRGDREAFTMLYELVAGQVYGAVRKVLRDPAQSEEVAQEVLLEVWRTASRFDAARSSAGTWIMTLAHRRAVDRVRSETTSRARLEEAGRAGTPSPVDAVVEEAELRAEHDLVRQALCGLSEVQRQAVVLAYYRGHSHREVAELLGEPLGTVKTRLRDAVIRLRNLLDVAS